MHAQDARPLHELLLSVYNKHMQKGLPSVFACVRPRDARALSRNPWMRMGSKLRLAGGYLKTMVN